DLVQPFQLEGSHLRGRLGRLGPGLTIILHQHAYPPVLGAFLGEARVSGAALTSSLKYDGVFTLQAKGDGPVTLLVVDVTSGGDVRAYACFDGARLAAVDTTATFQSLVGQGYLAFTVDQGEKTEGYQGIVALTG